MRNKKELKTVRSLFSIELEEPVTQQNIDEPKVEAKRVVKRLSKIVKEHYEASLGLGVFMNTTHLHVVTHALRDHAQGGSGELALQDYDEILSHCLTRLYEELVEEPSNILYVTSTSSNSVRYDAMNSSFWIDCLNLLETNSPLKSSD